MPSFARQACFVVALALLSPLAGAGQQQAFKIRNVPGLTEETRIQLGRLGEPLWRTVEAPGQTLREVLRATCGSQGAKADVYFEKATLTLNGAESLNQFVEPGFAVALPFCLEVKPVTVDHGDTLEKLLREHYGAFGPRSVRQTYELNRVEIRSANVREFTRHLEPGREIYLPTARERVFRPLPASSAAFTELTATLDNAIVSMGPQPVAAERPAHEYEYIEFVSSADANGMPDCGPATTPLTFSVQALQERLEAEGRAAIGIAAARPAIVGIIDTGIGNLGGSFFATRFFAPNQDEESGDGEDNDKNFFVDDIYGINFNGGTQNGSVAFYGGDDIRQLHGTKIASLVLGGPDWVRSLNPAVESRIRLKIVNYSDSTTLRPVRASELTKAIDYLTDEEADVVNMSLSNTQPVAGVQEAIERARKTLFVVAAGNKPAGLNLASSGVYPAGQGGRAGKLGDRVITVGAHDNAGSWVQFSNFSHEYVDLLAPGCAIPTIGIDDNEVKESGTSVATAIVSFAAGLVRSLGEANPKAIKNRLLSSVDVDPLLMRIAWTSGRLNVLKAVSLRHDVIEALSQSASYQYGTLRDRNRLRMFCADERKRPSLVNLLKVRPNIARDGQTYIEYWGERNDRSLWREECLQILEDQSIGGLLVDGVEVPGPFLQDVRDIVLATKNSIVPP